MSIEYGKMSRDEADLVFGGLFDPHHKIGAAMDDLPYGSPASAIRHMGKLVQFAPDAIDYFSIMADRLGFDFAVNFGDTIEDTQELSLDYQAFLEVINRLRELRMETLHIIGNHDRQAISDPLLRLGLGFESQEPFYFSRDFCEGAYRVIVMETPIYHEHPTPGYKGAPSPLPDEQLHWLEGEIQSACGQVIILSHHPFADYDLQACDWFRDKPHRAIVPNRAAVRDILERHRDQVLGAINGHLHMHQLRCQNGIDYLTVDSATEDIGGQIFRKPRMELLSDEHIPGMNFGVFYVKDGRIIADMHGFSQPDMAQVSTPRRRAA